MGRTILNIQAFALWKAAQTHRGRIADEIALSCAICIQLLVPRAGLEPARP
jgi:hypothetical protein